jgi:ABC-type uncharacterized transport system permease subunit
MSNRATIAALAALVLMTCCALMGSAAVWAADRATDRAATLATEATTATSDAHAVSVCVGLFNIGACTARQTVTAVTARPAAADDLGPSPWPLILPLSAVLMLVVSIMLRGLTWLDGER